MQKLGIVVVVALATAAFAVSDMAAAKRLGGGGGIGMQRQGVAPRPPAATPGPAAQPVMPAQPGAALPAKPAVPAAPAPSGMSRWLGPIAGIAAGLGLAALLSHFGLPEGMGSFLLLALLAVAGVVVVRMLLARRASPKPAMQYAGAAEPRLSKGAYQADAAAPAGGSTPRQEPVMPAAAPAVPADASAAKPLPPGFDAEGFARQAKVQFNRLQAAYDAADRDTMAQVMTPEMFTEVTRELAARGEHKPTEVVSLHAGVLEVTTEGASHWASVRYTGVVREDGEANPKPIDEVWNLTKPVDGSSGWLLAGIQQTA
jgi:predicted lipid-binding transport protein (Tim44 family)